MKTKNQFYLLIICNIIALCGVAWLTIYVLNDAKSNNVEQNNKIQILDELISYKFKLIDKKLDSLNKELNDVKIALQQQNSLQFIDNTKKELLNKLIEISDSIISLKKEKISIIENTRETQNQDQDQTLRKNFDSNKLQQVLDDVKSDNFYTRQRAYKIMALVGSQEQKYIISQIILDKEEDTSLRRELIETMDWDGFGSGLITLLKETGYPEIQTSVISKAEETQFTPDEKLQFENVLSNKFVQEQDDESRKTILKYFANTNKELIGQLIGKIDVNALSPELIEHIQSIQQFPSE
jgi:hypothetical protein